LVKEPSLWPAQLLWNRLPAAVCEADSLHRLGASSKHICLLCVLMTDYLFLIICFYRLL